MRAVRLIESGRPLEMCEIDAPGIGRKDVLVRVKSAGICHSDAHYRAGTLSTGPLPVTPGHEVAGIAERVGADVAVIRAGDRVCLHYMVTCGNCVYCVQGREQFCTAGSMIGKDRDGGYAEFIGVPERSVFLLPAEIPFDQGAVMMCSSATALHALNRGRVGPGETVAVWGTGGLGISAVQLARLLGAPQVYAVDLRESKPERARRLGAIPVNATETDPEEEILRRTAGRGVDLVLEFVGLEGTMKRAVRSLAVGGRLVIAGLGGQSLTIRPYADLLNRETEVIGVSDHTAREIHRLIEWVGEGQLVLDGVVTNRVPLDADAINDVLNDLEANGDDIRVVITP